MAQINQLPDANRYLQSTDWLAIDDANGVTKKVSGDRIGISPYVATITAGQWSGSGNDYYITVNASNVTADSILIPHYDNASVTNLTGPVWCVPAAGSFTIHTSALPTGTVSILVQFVGVMGEAQYQVLADVYSTSQAVAKADIVNTLTSTSTTAPLSAAQGKALADNRAFKFLLSASGTSTTWADIYNKVKSLSTYDVATFFASGGAASLLTGGKVTSTMKGVVAYNGSGTYDFWAFAGLGPYAYGWRVTNLTSASSTGTVGTVYQYTGISV